MSDQVPNGKTLRDEYTMSILSALICADGGAQTDAQYARRSLDMANAVLAMRAADKRDYLNSRKNRNRGDNRGNYDSEVDYV